MRTTQDFLGSASQRVVAGLLCVLVLLIPTAMFSTIGPRDRVQWIGMGLVPLSPEVRLALGLPVDAGGVLVATTDGVAASAGITPGDVLLRINAESVPDLKTLIPMIRKVTAAKQTVQLDLARRGVQIPVFVDPTALPVTQTAPVQPVAPGVAAQVAPLAPAVPLFNEGWLGIEVEPFTANDATAQGFPAQITGLVVGNAVPGSKAEQMGMIAGDIILSVNAQRVAASADLWRILGSIGAADPVQFSVYRRGQLVYLTLPSANMTRVAAIPCPVVAPVASAPAPAAGTQLLPGAVVCPYCRTRISRRWGMPGSCINCPSCGAAMVQGDLVQ